jgi:hypothetical protein
MVIDRSSLSDDVSFDVESSSILMKKKEMILILIKFTFSKKSLDQLIDLFLDKILMDLLFLLLQMKMMNYK